MSRVSRDQVLMENAVSWAKRSTCLRKHVGAVFSRNGRPLITGYNGAPSGAPHCLDHGCLIGPDGGCVRCNHAEANAITWAAREGISLKGTTLHVTVSPCQNCAMLLLNLGVEDVVYLEEYRKSNGIIKLREAGIIVEQFNGVINVG